MFRLGDEPPGGHMRSGRPVGRNLHDTSAPRDDRHLRDRGSSVLLIFTIRNRAAHSIPRASPVIFWRIASTASFTICGYFIITMPGLASRDCRITSEMTSCLMRPGLVCQVRRPNNRVEAHLRYAAGDAGERGSDQPSGDLDRTSRFVMIR
jgi:hypothetical protein